jgi:hypothetical protein
MKAPLPSSQKCSFHFVATFNQIFVVALADFEVGQQHLNPSYKFHSWKCNEGEREVILMDAITFDGMTFVIITFIIM